MNNYVGATENQGFWLKGDTHIRFMRLVKTPYSAESEWEKLA